MENDIYLFLGASTAEREAILADIIRNGLSLDTEVCVYAPENSIEILKEHKHFQNRLEQTHFVPFSVEESHVTLESTNLPACTSFFLTDGSTSPADQIEAFSQWLRQSNYKLASVITIVDCKQVLDHTELKQWYDACIHFSDSVLLTNRNDVPQQWIKEFIEHYSKTLRYPCPFVYVKKNHISNPTEILDAPTRRISMLFETDIDIYDELPEDEDEYPDEPFDLIQKDDPLTWSVFQVDNALKYFQI